MPVTVKGSAASIIGKTRFGTTCQSLRKTGKIVTKFILQTYETRAVYHFLSCHCIITLYRCLEFRIVFVTAHGAGTTWIMGARINW